MRTHTPTQKERVLHSLLDIGQGENSSANFNIKHIAKSRLNNIRGYCNKPTNQKTVKSEAKLQKIYATVRESHPLDVQAVNCPFMVSYKKMQY